MKAIVFDNELKLDNNYKKPIPNDGEALIRVKLAGICNTDYEITMHKECWCADYGCEQTPFFKQVCFFIFPVHNTPFPSKS